MATPTNDDLVTPTTTREFPLGIEVGHLGANASKWYRYVRADDAVAVNATVKLDLSAAGSGLAADAPFLVTPTTNVNEIVEGIAETALAAGEYGWILFRGPSTCISAAGVAAGDQLVTTANDGELDTIIVVTTVDPTKTELDAQHTANAGPVIIATTAVASSKAEVYIR